MNKNYFLGAFLALMVLTFAVFFSPVKLSVNEYGEVEGFIPKIRSQIMPETYWRGQLEIIEREINYNRQPWNTGDKAYDYLMNLDREEYLTKMFTLKRQVKYKAHK